MKFYSEITNKLYDSEEELNRAELQVRTAEKEKEKETKVIAADIKEVMDSFDKVAKASKEFGDVSKNYFKKYKNNKAACRSLCTALTDKDYDFQIYTKYPLKGFEETFEEMLNALLTKF